MKITDFYENTTKEFDVTIYYDGDLANIVNDTVTLYVKETPNDTDANALIVKSADVSDGANGIASFTLTDSDTTIPVKKGYYAELVWETVGGSRFVVHQQRINCLNKMQDNS